MKRYMLSSRKEYGRPAQIDTEVAGITWMEMFTMHDVIGDRSEEGQPLKNLAATKRAENRGAKARCANIKQTESQ